MYCLYQYQYPGHNPHLWQGSKCYWKGTLRIYKEVPRSQKVSLELGGGPREEHSLIGEDWSHGRTEIKEDGDEEEGSEDGSGESQEEETPLSAFC